MKDREREGRGKGEDKGHRCNELQGAGLDPEERLNTGRYN